MKSGAEDPIYAELFGDAPAPVPAPTPIASGISLGARKQPAKLPQHPGDKPLRADKLRITFVIWSRETSDSPSDDRMSIIFEGKSPTTGTMKWRGKIAEPDTLHEYSVLYRVVPDSRDASKQMCAIVAVLAARQSSQEAKRLSPVLFSKPAEKGGSLLGPFLRLCGNDKWLKAAESQTT